MCSCACLCVSDGVDVVSVCGYNVQLAHFVFIKYNSALCLNTQSHDYNVTFYFMFSSMNLILEHGATCSYQIFHQKSSHKVYVEWNPTGTLTVLMPRRYPVYSCQRSNPRVFWLLSRLEWSPITHFPIVC